MTACWPWFARAGRSDRGRGAAGFGNATMRQACPRRKPGMEPVWTE
nr:hypothetical protein RVX_1438 [Nitratidesulfovibrio sp. HK-II]